MTYISVHRKLRLILIVVMITILGGVTAIFLTYRTPEPTQEAEIAPEDNGADVSIGKIHHVSTKDGVVQWSLDAKSAAVVEKGQKVILQDVSVIFFMEDGQKAYLTADKGYLRASTSDIDVMGNVMLRYQNFTLETDRLRYRHKKRLVFTQTPVLISDDLSHLMADSLYFDLNSNTTHFNGNIEGFLSGKFKL
jgi:LPS export ABC transporter protein LptC